MKTDRYDTSRGVLFPATVFLACLVGAIMWAGCLLVYRALN